MRSLFDNKWETFIDRAKFEQIFPKIKVCRESDYIVIKFLGNQAPLKVKQIIDQEEFVLKVEHKDISVLHHIACLIQAKVLKKVLLLNSKENDPLLRSTADMCDLELIQVEENVLML